MTSYWLGMATNRYVKLVGHGHRPPCQTGWVRCRTSFVNSSWLSMATNGDVKLAGYVHQPRCQTQTGCVCTSTAMPNSQGMNINRGVSWVCLTITMSKWHGTAVTRQRLGRTYACITREEPQTLRKKRPIIFRWGHHQGIKSDVCP